jgi:hypothetical protein
MISGVAHPSLPCYPCPHRSACCAFGTTLSPREARGIIRKHGADKVYLTRWGEWRTRVKNGRCVLWKDNACGIYNTPEYPEVGRGFPFVDAETGGPYEFDQTICPEFLVRPELIQLSRMRREKNTNSPIP